MMKWLASQQKSRRRNLIWILTAVVLSVVGMIAIFNWRMGGPTPSLDEIRALARARQFDRARALLQRYLQSHPKNARAHLLMASLATEPADAHPSLALEHLNAIRPESPKQAALVKLYEGKAHYQQGRYDLAETCWTEAMRLDPLVPEAGWMLIDLLDKESRTAEAHRLGMRMHEIEPDPRDKIRILLEMSRIDIESPDPLSQVQLFESLVKEHPEFLPLSLTLGQALIHANRSGEGLEIIEGTLKRYPDSPEAWDAWLTGLYQASEADRLAQEFARLPSSLAGDPRFAKHEAMIAQIARDWPKAVHAYRRAFAFEPFNWGVCYRLRFALRQAGEIAELEQIDRIYDAYKDAHKQMHGSFFERFEPGETPDFPADDFNKARGAYYETLSIKTLGAKPHPELYHRLADLREKMGRFDEARAWHRLVVRDSPNDPVSLAALERLK
jgi:tetratricopeptide (TPR) repeat protein